MRKLIATTTLAAFALAPALGSACEYMDDAKADGGSPALLATAQPEASKVLPDSAFTKAQAPVKKQVASKPRAAAPEQQKVAAANAPQ